MEKLKNIQIQQQLAYHKQLVENYQKQIEQLSKSLDKSNASIQVFAQTKLLEMKSSLSIETQPQTKPKIDRPQDPEPVTPQLDTKNESKRGWFSWLK